jgi:hypothetical protein
VHQGRKGNRKGSSQRHNYRAALALATIPFYLGVAPLVGWWIGRWADSKLNTDWAFQAIGVALGFVAAIRETVRMVRRAQRDLDQK